MFSQRPGRRAPDIPGIGGPPIHRDLWILLGVIFVTFTFQFFASTRPLIQLLQLSPAVWQRGFLWQLLTYGFTGHGGPSFWFLFQLLMIFWFGRDVFSRLGRKAFWLLLAWGVGTAGVTAVVFQLLLSPIPGAVSVAYPFVLIQGQHILLVILVAAFATLYRDSVIYLFFVLPIKAKWFLPLEIVFGFLGYLGSRDLAGFLGLTAAVALTWSILTPGGMQRLTREGWLRLQHWRYKRKLQGLEQGRGWKGKGGTDPGRKPGTSGPKGGDGDGNVRQGPWVH